MRKKYARSDKNDLFAEVEKQVLQDLGFQVQIPTDPKMADKQNILR